MQSTQFEWISNDEAPFLTVDNQRRIYFNAGSRSLLGVKPYQQWLVGYDIANRRLILAKPELINAVNVVPFSVDKRFYMSARKFVDKLGIDDLPVNFHYLTHVTSAKDKYPAGSYVFQAEDGGKDGVTTDGHASM